MWHLHVGLMVASFPGKLFLLHVHVQPVSPLHVHRSGVNVHVDVDGLNVFHIPLRPPLTENSYIYYIIFHVGSAAVTIKTPISQESGELGLRCGLFI